MAGAGEMAQNLRTLVALAEEPGLFPASVLFFPAHNYVTPVLRDLIPSPPLGTRYAYSEGRK